MQLPRGEQRPSDGASESSPVAGNTLQQLLQEPAAASASEPSSSASMAPSSAALLPSPPDDPSDIAIPVALPVLAAAPGIPVTISARDKQLKVGDIYTLSGEVIITYRGYILRADKVIYNRSTSEVEAEGHLQLEGGSDDEVITASHGTINLEAQTARFFDVLGSIGVRPNPQSRRIVYTTLNPFIFTGRIIIKTGPAAYRIIDGTMTSCRLPKPDWRLFASEITVDGGRARARNSTFRLLHVPVFYLPYVTHPVNVESRESGLLIPTFGTSSTKGTILGESFYWAISRSADLTAGAEYYSKRGWAPNAELRFKGADENFATLRFTALLDRGLSPAHINQGGEDLLFNGRRDFGPTTRAAANIEYLSSYVYRQAFNENFQQAVSSEVKSDAFLVHSGGGWHEDLRFDRYQSFVRSQSFISATPSSEIRILHLPSLDFEAVDQPLGPAFGPALGRALGRAPASASGNASGSPSRHAQLYWGFAGSGAGLSRTEPSFSTTREVGRIDLYPHLSLPIHLLGWSFRPEGALRDTFYSKSQHPGSGVPTESDASLNRGSVEADFELRPPVIERVFNSGRLIDATHHEFKHTVEPVVQYRFVTGINNFNQVLRFDTADIVSNTNEITYSLTQRLFLKNLNTHPCRQDEAAIATADTAPVAGVSPGAISQGSADTISQASTGANPDPETRSGAEASSDAGTDAAIDTANPMKPTRGLNQDRECGGGTREWISWLVAQRYYFDPTFGGATTPGRRNVLDSTLDLTGVAFILRPRNTSPLLSRLRVRTTGNTDLEWDLDYNTRAGRIQSSNLFANYHQGNFFTGIGQSRMVALEPSITSTGQSSPFTTYDQLRLLAGFGGPGRRGLSLAANTGYDFTEAFLQYAGLQSSYNWDCCGLSVEYRRFALGSVRNENQYRFNFTLAGIGTAGNLRRAERLF